MAYPIYIVGFILLIIVEVMGQIGMGAQRWINLGFVQIQPSELMKIAVTLALARYFHAATPEEMKSIRFLIPALFLIIAPVGLVLLQPNLGTSLMIVMGGAAVMFLAGAPIRWFLLAGAGVAAMLPVAWSFMHPYQKRRVLTLLNPESEPLGAGWNIIQSKTAIGSGGIYGKGWLNGVQSRLDFLPEGHTDFIMAVLAEEFGLAGMLFLLALYVVIIGRGLYIGAVAPDLFSRLVAGSITLTFFVYVFVNIGMVTGILPVVGVPLPLVSIGGTSIVTLLLGFGILMSIHTHGKTLLR